MNKELRNFFQESAKFLSPNWDEDTKASELARWVIEDPNEAGISNDEVTNSEGAVDEGAYSWLRGEAKAFLKENGN